MNCDDSDPFFGKNYYQIMSLGEGVYTIKSKHAGRVMDVCQDVDRKGMLIIYDGYGGVNQQFVIRPNGVEVELLSKQTGKILTIAANSSKNGAPVFEEPAKGLEGQRFRLQ